MREFHRKLVDWLGDQGATAIALVPTKKHPRVTFRWRGQLHKYPIPSTPSDRRAFENQRAFLKRAMNDNQENA